MINFDRKLSYNTLDEKTIEYINSLKYSNPSESILVEIPNTKGISSELLKKLSSSVYIRIAGGYDEELIKHRGNTKFVNGETGEYYTSAVIYTRNEAIRIVSELEKIESKFNNNWSDLQKLIFCYIRLKSSIMYDPKYMTKSSDEVRSLRGLITKQTVCAGYSMILKEILDRQNIKCHYVEGHSPGGHAWNIVEIDGKKYGIDLTWENSKYRGGELDTYDFLAQDVKKFAEKHKPLDWYELQDYENNLSTIDKNVIKGISSQLNREVDYMSTTYRASRSDGSKFLLAQVGDATIDGIKYYRYYYADLLDDGSYSNPLLLYSESNIAKLINDKNFGNYYPQGAFQVVCDVLFSKENIEDSLKKKTFYIGKYRKGGKGVNTQLVSNYKEIDKPKVICSKFNYATKIFERSDGSSFVIQQTSEQPIFTPSGFVYRYVIFEVVKEKGKSIVKKNVVFSEMNLLSDGREEIINKFLSRKALDRSLLTSGGYIGYLDVNGNRIYNPDLVEYFNINKNIDINGKINKNKLKKESRLIVPKKNDFSENLNTFIDFKTLYDFAMKYELVNDSKSNQLLVRNIKTKEIVNDKDIISKALLANIWLSSAGLVTSDKDTRIGETYAFSQYASSVYKLFFDEMFEDVKKNGTIDTVKLFKKSLDLPYEYSSKIIVNLFRNPYQTKIINELFREFAKVNSKESKIPEVLYSLDYAMYLLGDKKDNSKKNSSDNKNKNDNGNNNTVNLKYSDRIDKISNYYNSVVSKLSELDKEIYLKLKSMLNNNDLVVSVLNLMDGYLHNVVINKDLKDYFTGKDLEIINSFKLDSNKSNSDLMNDISIYNQKIYSINYFADRVKRVRENSSDQSKKDVEKNNTVVKIKRIPDMARDKAKTLKENIKDKELLKGLKDRFQKKESNDDKKNNAIVEIKKIPDMVKGKAKTLKENIKDKELLKGLKDRFQKKESNDEEKTSERRR